MRAYHVTSQENLEDILEHGLSPRTGDRAAERGEPGDAVYCFTSMEACEDALMNWLGELFDEDDALMILSLKVDGLARRPSEVEWEIAIEEPISPDRIVKAVDEEGESIPLRSATNRRRG